MTMPVDFFIKRRNRYKLTYFDTNNWTFIIRTVEYRFQAAVWKQSGAK